MTTLAPPRAARSPARLHRPVLLLVAAAIAVAGCDAPPGSTDSTVRLHPNGDALAAERHAVVREDVTGDAMIFGETASYDGEAGGSVLAFGRDVDVEGRVDGSVRSAGATVTVRADVGRNVTAAGGTVVLASGTRVTRNAYLAGGEVRIDGIVDGDLYLGAENATIDGTVGGDVRVEAHTLRLGPEARIEGELRYRLDSEGSYVPDAGARIAEGVEELPRREGEEPGRGFGFLFGRVVAFLLAGTVIVALAPKTLAALVEPIEHRPGASAGAGLLAMLAVPVGVIVVAVTVIGVPLAVTAAVLFAMAWYFAPVVPALWLGREMLGTGFERTSDEVKAFLLGGTVVALAGVAPWIGFPTHLIATAFGLGAVALTVMGRRRREAPEA